MNKVYNTQEEIASKIADILLKVNPNIRKTQLKIIPHIILGMNISESVVASDIAKQLKGDFSLVQNDSVIKRIRRLLKNKYFDPYDFYDKIIRFVISKYKNKHKDNRVHIIFDHMFSHDNYTVFMITMRVGKQGIPLWFRCFQGKSDSDAYSSDIIKNGISYVSSLFDESFNLIFLADRWFNDTSVLNYIDSLGHTYCIRLKNEIKVLYFDDKEGHYIWKHLKDMKTYEYHPVYYDNVFLTEHKLKTNVVFAKRHGSNDLWIITTNGDSRRAIKDYSYRFGGIESIFKNQKSNGFYLEKTVNASLKYFESLYSLACFNILWMTIIGADYVRNRHRYSNFKIKTHYVINGVKTRVMSLFNTGLTIFNRAYNASRYLRIPFHFTLYDM